jgi:L-fuconolactonase
VPTADSHCHVSPSWYEPVEVLLFQMERNGVDHAALIQMAGQFDNSYQQECVKRFPGKFASVVVVDVNREDAVADLERWAGEGASGVRLGPDAPLRLWEAAARLGLSVSCGGSRERFASPEFDQLFAHLPEVPIVIEHLGGLKWDSTGGEQIFALARHPNAYMKIHGLGEFSRRASPAKEPLPFVEPLANLLDQAYEAFGPSRLMWGSDYPPVSSREGYANALSFTRTQLQGRPGLDEIFGNTAVRVFATK